MYCKNCGRQLKEGMRFCDRCGQSVRKSRQSTQVTKRQEIEELKTERLNRKKRLAEKEARQNRNKKRRKNNGNAFIFIIVILLIAVLSTIIGYNIFAGDGGKGNATPTPSASATVSPSATQSTTGSKKGYAEIKVGSVTCPYPSNFHSNTLEGNEKLNLTDAFGGATMIVSQEAKSGEAKNLMAEYAAKCGNVSYSRAGSDWYAITYEDEGVINHRKCVIRNSLAVYYDFSYNADSGSSEKYTEYIEYIDANFK